MTDQMQLDEYIANFEKAAKECPWPGTAESYEKVCGWLKELKDKKTERTAKAEWSEVDGCHLCGEFARIAMSIVQDAARNLIGVTNDRAFEGHFYRIGSDLRDIVPAVFGAGVIRAGGEYLETKMIEAILVTIGLLVVSLVLILLWEVWR